MLNWIIDRVILRYRKFKFRIKEKSSTQHLWTRIVTDSFYYVKSEGYIIGRIRFKTAGVEDFILLANVSDKNKPKINLKSPSRQLLSSPGSEEVLPSDPSKKYKIIGEWRTAVNPEPSDAEDEVIFKKIEEKKRKYYLLAIINKADYSYKNDRKYWVIFYLYSRTWRKWLGHILISNTEIINEK